MCAAMQNRASLAASCVGVRTLALNLAEDCNLRCSYCHFGAGPYGMSPARMTVETVRRAIDCVLVISEEPVLLVYFFGGEPLLNPEVLFAAYNHAREKGRSCGKVVEFVLVTNATLLQGELAEALLEMEIRIVAGVDGPAHAHDAVRVYPDGAGTYAMVCEALRPWIERDRVAAVVVVGDTCDPMEALECLRKLGIRQFIFRLPMRLRSEQDGPSGLELGRLEEAFTALAEAWGRQLSIHPDQREWSLEGGDALYSYVSLALTGGQRSFPCDAGARELAVAADGGIYPCPYFAGEKAFRVGEAARGVDDRALAAFIGAGMVERKEECIDCPAKYACAGGCLRDAIATTRRTDAPNPARCGITRHLVRLAAGIATDLQQAHGPLAPLYLQAADLRLYLKLCQEYSIAS